MKRKSFSFYQSFYKAIQCLDNDEDKLKAYDYIVTYGITWQEPKEKDGVAYTLFVFSLSSELSLPVLFAGVGEKMDDLEYFNSKDFVDGIL